MWREQKKLLDKLKKNYGKFRVASRTSYGVWSYSNYPSNNAKWFLEHDSLTDRNIMIDEIIIESDLPMIKMTRGVTIQHERKLLKYGFSYEKWFSGNKSFHLQIVFPEIGMIQEPYKRKIIKQCFIKWLVGIDNVSRHKIDMMLCGNHLIKLERSWHHMTGERKRMISENESDVVNRIPQEVWEMYVN